MFFFREIQQCFRSLLQLPLRSILSTLGVLFGVISIITMLSIGEGAKQETLEQIEQLGMNNLILRETVLSDEQRAHALEKKSRGLSPQNLENLRHHLPMLVRDAPLKVVEAPITVALNDFSPEILAVTRSFGEMKELKLSEGRFLCDLDQKEKRLVCILGYEVAHALGRQGHMGNTLRLNHTHYEIIGILKSVQWKESKNQLIAMRNLDRAIFIPLGSEIGLTNKFSSNKDHLSEIVLQIHDTQDMAATAQLVKKILGHSHHGYEDYQLIIPQELIQQANRTQQTFNYVLGSIAGISLLVGGIGIMNIMLANVSERTGEIGIRRAVGANQYHILLQFILEALLLTFFGTLLGIFFGIGLSMLLSEIAGWRTIVTPWSIILSLSMSFLVGIASGLYPAYKAAQMDPIKALRHN